MRRALMTAAVVAALLIGPAPAGAEPPVVEPIEDLARVKDVFTNARRAFAPWPLTADLEPVGVTGVISAVRAVRVARRDESLCHAPFRVAFGLFMRDGGRPRPIWVVQCGLVALPVPPGHPGGSAEPYVRVHAVKAKLSGQTVFAFLPSGNA
jgi:hypothetical protein